MVKRKKIRLQINQLSATYQKKRYGIVLFIKQGVTKPVYPKNNQNLTFHSINSLVFIQNENIDSEKMTENIITESESAVSKRKTKKQKIISLIFFIINIAIVVGIVVYNFVFSNPVSITELFQTTINWWWLLIGIVIYFVLSLFDSFRTFILIKHSTGNSRPWLSYKSSAICRYYDSITPMSTGGQPFQIFYLRKWGMSASSATSVPIAKYVLSQICFTIGATIVLLVHHTKVLELSPVVVTACWIGYALSLVLVLSVAFLAISKKVAPACVSGILKFLSKLHLIKDYRRTFLKVMRGVREYISITRRFVKNFWVMLWVELSAAIYWLLYNSLVFVVYCMLVDFDINMWLPILIATVVCDMASNYMPLPGASGAAEGAFLIVFGVATIFTTDGSPIFSGDLLVWAMLFWRVLNYYGNILQGLVILAYDFFHGNKKIPAVLEKYQKKESLDNQQIKNRGIR